MALTRPRYSQIPDSDYKNSCRIVTTTNVTLTGSAPLTYDGVTLVQYDRVLVAGQTDKTQNGIYSVSTLGSGSNGTWVRSKDANANDRLTAGMNTFIEEGTYTGQFWHLLTPGPIVLGVTELIFGQISGNAAGISSQVQYNSSGSIAGAANLRYDSATGNVLIGGGTASTSNVTGALTVNGGIGVTGEIWAQGNIYSVGSRVLTAYDLETVTFTANYISKDPANVAVPVVGTGTIYGTHNFGNLEAISTYGDYNTTAESGYYSVNDATGAPAFIVYIGFTGISSFNRAVYNVNYTASSGHTVNIDMYNYETDAWDTFATYSGSGNWQQFALGVIDHIPYIDNTGNVTTRIYHVSSGNTAHRTWIDYVALEQSITGGQGPRGATGPTGPSGTYTGGFISGTIITAGNIVTSGNFVSNSGNISISTTTGALIITGDGGAGIGGNIFAGGNVTANAFYTVNGLFWSGNGLAFSSGLEVSEINTANILSNISSQVTSLRFDKDTGFTVTELDPGNVKISLGSSFKTWHVPGQADLVAVAEDEVTFFGNGIDITTNPTFPKAITFIANNSILEANIGAFYNYANANIGTLYLGNVSTQANLGELYLGNISTQANLGTLYLGNISTQANIGTIKLDLQTLDANVGAFESYANANIGTLYLGNISTQANLGAYQIWANGLINGALSEISALTTATSANAGVQSIAIAALNANLGAYQLYANANIGSIYNNLNTLDANIGSYQIYANANAATQTINYETLSANIGAFELYANSKIGDNSNGNLVVRSTEEAYSPLTGALVVKGGAGFGGNVWVAGNIYAGNLISVSTTTISVTDPLVYLTASDPFPYNYDIGFFSHFVGGSPSHYQHTGMARDYTTNYWTFFSNVNTEPGAVIDWAEANLIYDTVRLGDIIVSNTTQSTSTTTGALRVSGGAGIQGELYIANAGDVSANIGRLHLGNIELNANLGAYQLYANANIGSIYNNLNTLDANIGAYQTYANANAATLATSINTHDANIGRLHLGNISTQANLGTLYLGNISTQANLGELYLGNVSTQANLGAFQTYSNANAATLATSINTLDANIGTLYLGNISTQANLGAYQTWANANFGTGTYSNTNVTAYLTQGANIGSGSTTSNLVAAATTTSTSTTTGALVVRGGMGVAGAAYIGGATRVTVGTASTNSTSGALVVTGGVGISGALNVGTTGTFSSSQTSTDPTTGALIIVGGVGIGGALNVSSSGSFGESLQTVGNLYAGGNVILGSGVNSNVVANATTTSTSTTTGALVVRGGMGVAGNAYVGGNVILGAGATSNVVIAATTASGNITSGALVVAGGVGIAGNLYSNANVILGAGVNSNVVANATTTSTSTTTGALVVRGGMGVAGNAYVGGNVILGTGATSNVVIAATTVSGNINSGALVVKGGIGVTGAAFIGSGTTTSNLVAAATTTSTSSTTGALVVAGGMGVAGTVYAPGAIILGTGTTTTNVVANATTTSTSTTTGALVVRGGTGIAGNAYVGGNIVVSSGIDSRSTTTGAVVVTGGVGVSGNIYTGANIFAASGNVTTGNVYTSGGIYWSGNNAVYGSQFEFTSSSTAPSSPTVGDFWYYTDDQILFQYINDGTTNYWVDVQTAPLSANISQEIFVGNTTIGGNMTISGNTSISSSIVENVYTVVDAPGVSISPANGTMQLWTLGASRTPTTTFYNGQSMTLMITAGSYSITWSTMGVSWITGLAPVLSTSTVTVIEFWKAGDTLYGGLVGTI